MPKVCEFSVTEEELTSKYAKQGYLLLVLFYYFILNTQYRYICAVYTTLQYMTYSK